MAFRWQFCAQSGRVQLLLMQHSLSREGTFLGQYDEFHQSSHSRQQRLEIGVHGFSRIQRELFQNMSLYGIG
jgi:hypothetical protein